MNVMILKKKNKMWIVYNLLQSLGIEVFQPQSISGMSHPWLRVSWQKRLLSFQVFLAIDPVIDDVTTWRCGPNELAWAVAMEKCMGARHEVRIRLIKKQSFAFFYPWSRITYDNDVKYINVEVQTSQRGQRTFQGVLMAWLLQCTFVWSNNLFVTDM